MRGTCSDRGRGIGGARGKKAATLRVGPGSRPSDALPSRPRASETGRRSWANFFGETRDEMVKGSLSMCLFAVLCLISMMIRAGGSIVAH